MAKADEPSILRALSKLVGTDDARTLFKGIALCADALPQTSPLKTSVNNIAVLSALLPTAIEQRLNPTQPAPPQAEGEKPVLTAELAPASPIPTR